MPLPSWLDDELVLEELRRGAREHLQQIRGGAIPLAVKGKVDWDRLRRFHGHAAFLDDYDQHTKLWHFESDGDTFLRSLGSDVDRRFLAGPGGEETMRHFLKLATSDVLQDRLAAAALARELAGALDPRKKRGQPSELDARRVTALYRWQRRLYSTLHRSLNRFATPPPASWLPAFIRHGGEHVTMRDDDWPHLAAVEWLAAALDVSDHTVVARMTVYRNSKK